MLVVACGTGDLTFALAQRNPETIRGVDFSSGMLEIAERITQTPPGVVTVNKRYVYTALEARGAPAGLPEARIDC